MRNNNLISKRDLAFVKKACGNSSLRPSRPLWKHSYDVGLKISQAAQKGGELDLARTNLLIKAALGHDLLEDTKTTQGQIEKRWGKKALTIIKDLSNSQGDKDFREYISKLQKGSEETLLVKFADILSNVSNSVRTFRSLDQGWIKNFWIPLLRRYERAFFKIKFTAYPKTAKYLKQAIEKKTHSLQKLIIENK